MGLDTFTNNIEACQRAQFVQTGTSLNFSKFFRKSKCHSIWRATREKGLSDVCVKCRFAQADLKRYFPFYGSLVYFSTKSNGVVKCRLGSACAIRAG